MSRLACATVDLDPLHVYLRNRGFAPDPGRGSEIVYQAGLRRFLALFEKRGIRATLFVVGEDVASAENAALLRAAASCGHEIASHSHTHPLGLPHLDRAVLRDEVVRAEEAIEAAVGVRVKGFRAPGWNVSLALFDLLRERGYQYDSSLVPLPLRGALPWLLRRGAGGPDEALFQGQRRWPSPSAEPYPMDPARPWAASRSRLAEAVLWEVPCGMASPVPLPLAYTASVLLGDPLASLAERLAVHLKPPLVYVFHALDLVDFETELRDHRLSGKPGVTDPLPRKRRRVERILTHLGRGRTWARLTEVAGPPPR